MNRNELAYLPLAEAARLIEEKQLSPVEVTELTLERIHDLNPRLNACYTVFSDEALAAARTAADEIAAGGYRGPLHGLPIALKDVYECGPTTCGSRLYSDYVADAEATAVTRLRAAGAVIIGKTATYEFAFGVPTMQSYFKPTRNPWDLSRDSGGSSSGSAVACAAGLAYGAMGSDTGGSIRWPAQCCGVVGIKPTYGLVSRAGIHPVAWSMDHVGPLARTVTDAALILEACAGHDPLDPASASTPPPNLTGKIGQDIKGLRIGLLRDLYEDNCSPPIRSVFEEAIGVFEKLGAEVVDLPLITLEQAAAIEWLPWFAEVAAVHIGNLRRRGDDLNPHTKLLAVCGLLTSSGQYVLANRVRAQVRDRLLAALRSEVDVVMLPTAGFQIGPIAEESPGLSFLAEEFTLYTFLFNFTGLPAIQVPCGFDGDGLPVGLQVGGASFDEATILQVAYAYEQATPWHARRPAL